MDGFLNKHLQGVSRTYAVVIPMLPDELVEPVGLAYLLMRVVDTLEDYVPLSDAERRAHFAELRAVLADDSVAVPESLTRPIGDSASEQLLMQELPRVIARLRALDPEYRAAAYAGAREMMFGVEQFMARAAERGRAYPAITSAAELREYCYYVAGVVGILLNRMMAHYLRAPHLLKLRDLAVELGIGLQLVNVIKDSLKDSTQGRRYLPVTDAGTLDASEIYRLALAEARMSLSQGIDFVLALPAHAAELRWFCGLPIAWGAMTLARAERDAKRAKISRPALLQSIARFKSLARQDEQLRTWLRDLLHSKSAVM